MNPWVAFCIGVIVGIYILGAYARHIKRRRFKRYRDLENSGEW